MRIPIYGFDRQQNKAFLEIILGKIKKEIKKLTVVSQEREISGSRNKKVIAYFPAALLNHCSCLV